LDELPDFERTGEIETAVCCFRYLPEPCEPACGRSGSVQKALQQRIEKSGKHSSLDNPAWPPRLRVTSQLSDGRRHVDDL